MGKKGRTKASDVPNPPPCGCTHYKNDTAVLNRILSRIVSESDPPSCHHCRDVPVGKRKGKHATGKKNKKGGGSATVNDSGSIWVCLDCERSFCGGEGTSEPYGHARRHAKQDMHPWAARPAPAPGQEILCWCFTCNSAIPLVIPIPSAGEEGEHACSGNGTHSKGDELDTEASSSSGFIVRGIHTETSISNGYIVRGLVNLGNTCFLNSLMQNLLSIRLLRDYFQGLDWPAGPITVALRDFYMETVAADSRRTLSPNRLLESICTKAPHFREGEQQDSHELFCILLEGINNEEENARKHSHCHDKEDKRKAEAGTTIVSDLFGGKLLSSVCCAACGYTSVVQETFCDLSLPIPSKKATPRKVPGRTHKTFKKYLGREGNRGSKFREKGSTKLAETKRSKMALPARDCDSPVIPQLVERQSSPSNDNSNEESSACWLDYLESAVEPEGSKAVLDVCEVSMEQSSEAADNGRSTLESLTSIRSVDLVVPSDSCAECLNRDETIPSCSQESFIIRHPCLELDSNVDEMNKLMSHSESLDGPASTALEQETSAANRSGHADENFYGMLELFDEPEFFTSYFPVETSTTERMNASISDGNASESTQEEIDYSSIPISVTGCLALYTMPEHLVDEWQCERCSEISSSSNEEHSKGKNHLSETSGIQDDENEGRGNDNPSKPDDCDGVDHKFVANGITASSSSNMNSDIERAGSPNMEFCSSKKSSNIVEALEISTTASAMVCHIVPEASGETKYDENNHLCSFNYNGISSEVMVHNHENATCSTTEQDIGRGEESVLCTSSTDNVGQILGNRENGSISDIKEKDRKHMKLLRKGDESGYAGPEKGKLESKVKRDATKRLLISNAPPILTIHLKRFSYDAHGRSNKLSGHVEFQETLDLRPYVDPRCAKGKCLFSLVGVVEHTGKTMRWGHYIAYVRGAKRPGKDQKNESPAWFKTSDDNVVETSLSRVLQSEAYILFYERV